MRTPAAGVVVPPATTSIAPGLDEALLALSPRRSAIEPHYRDPLPLGDPDGAPYSKALLERALVGAGGRDRARLRPRDQPGARADRDGRPLGVELERLREAARELLGESAGGADRPAAPPARGAGARSTVRSSCSSGARPAPASRRSRRRPPRLAHRLGITRSDLDRLHPPDDPGVLPPAVPADCRRRASFPPSFEVGGSPVHGSSRRGFVDQTRRVLVGVEAAIERALTEGWSMVIEGVHLVPGLVPAEIDGALLVHAVLRVSDVAEHHSHLRSPDTSRGESGRCRSTWTGSTGSGSSRS